MNKNNKSGDGEEFTTTGQKLEKLSDPDYLEEIITQVGTDINDIFAYIQKSTGLNYQKILSQRQGIQGYLNARKRIKTGDIREEMANSWCGNSVKTIVDNLKKQHGAERRREQTKNIMHVTLYEHSRKNPLVHEGHKAQVDNRDNQYRYTQRAKENRAKW